MIKALGMALVAFLSLYTVADLTLSPGWILAPMPRFFIPGMWAGSGLLFILGLFFLEIPNAQREGPDPPGTSELFAKQDRAYRWWGAIFVIVSGTVFSFLVLRIAW